MDPSKFEGEIKLTPTVTYKLVNPETDEEMHIEEHGFTTESVAESHAEKLRNHPNVKNVRVIERNRYSSSG